MTPMAALAHAVRQTDLRKAAEEFLAACDDTAEDIILACIDPPGGFAHWSLATIHDYEMTGSPVLIRGRWGDVWLCPADTPYYQTLEPRAPCVTSRGLRALGRALIDALAETPIMDPIPGLYP